MAKLEDYSFGRTTVDREEHTRELIVLPGRVVPDWWRAGSDARRTAAALHLTC
jgi:hypothetical protein